MLKPTDRHDSTMYDAKQRLTGLLLLKTLPIKRAERTRRENVTDALQLDRAAACQSASPAGSERRKRVEVRVHHPAQEDLASRPDVSTTGCQPQCLLPVLLVSTKSGAGSRAPGHAECCEGSCRGQQVQLRVARKRR